MGSVEDISGRQRGRASFGPRPRSYRLRDPEALVGGPPTAATARVIPETTAGGAPAVRRGAIPVVVSLLPHRSSAAPAPVVSESHPATSRRRAFGGSAGGGINKGTEARGWTHNSDATERNRSTRRSNDVSGSGRDVVGYPHCEVGAHGIDNSKKESTAPSPPRTRGSASSAAIVATTAIVMRNNADHPVRRLQNARLRSPEPILDTQSSSIGGESPRLIRTEPLLPLERGSGLTGKEDVARRQECDRTAMNNSKRQDNTCDDRGEKGRVCARSS